MKKKFKEYKGIICTGVLLLVGIFLLGYYIWVYQGLRYSYENHYPTVNEHSLIELNEETVIVQEFKTDNIHLKGFQYYLIKDSDTVGTFHVELGQGEEILIKREIPLQEINSGEWYFDFFDETLRKNELYTIKVYADKAAENKYPYIILMNPNDDCKENMHCYINGEKTDETMFISYNFAKLESTYVNAAVFILALFCSIVIMGIIFRYQYADKYQQITDSELFQKLKNIAVILIFAIQFILLMPNIVYRLTGLNLDPSWRYFLNIANDLGLKYGKDIYFTYGPLGYICYLMNLDNSITYWLGILIWIVIFAIHVMLLVLLYRLYKQHKVSLMAIILSFLCYITVFAESERDNYQLYILILSVIIYFLGNKKAVFFSNIMLMLMFFCKFSTFTSGVAFITIFVVLQLIFNKDRGSILLMLPSLVGAPIAYLLYNPSFKGLYEYVTGILRISSGWMKTQQWDDAFSQKEYMCLILIIAIYILLIVMVMIVDYHKSTILISCSASLFFAYKYGVTAHGIAMSIWLTALLFSVVMLTIDFKAIGQKIHEKKYYPWIFAMMVVSCCGIASLQVVCLHNNFDQLKASMSGKLKTFLTLGETSLMPELYENTYIPAEILETIGDDTVTVYPWEIGYKAVYTDLNMVYSPSIQNCNEFIPWLDQKVADYFYSDKAPEYIILEDETIYFHIKYLDNPLTWEALKDEYFAVTTQEEFCLLKKRDASLRQELQLIRTEEYQLTETIACPDDADYVKIHLEYSVLGNIQEFLWRSGMTHMTIRYQDGREDRGVIIVPNMPSGFSLDYVPQNIDDVPIVLNTEDYGKMETLEFSGIGLNVLQDSVKVEWYRYE